MKPTQAQIEAAAKGICMGRDIEPVDSTDGSPNWWMFSKDAEAALTAAAQVGEKTEDEMHFEKQERHDHQVELYITLGHAMIERCAQVADKLFHSEDARAIAAAIRKLKDAP